MEAVADLKQSYASEKSVNSKQDVAVQLSALHSVEEKAGARSYSHPSPQYFPSTVPVQYPLGNSPNITPALLHGNTNPEKNQAFTYPVQYLEQRVKDPNIGYTQGIDGLNSKYVTELSTLGQHNANKTYIAYHAMHSNQLQVIPAIISATTRPVVPMSGTMPTSNRNLFQPIWTNVKPIQNVQPLRATTPNISGRIDHPLDRMQRKFNLTPEIPDQIFTLPGSQIENSTFNNIQDQNTATSNLEQPKELNKVAELAKISHYSKKNLLYIDIPKTPPPKSIFPSYSTLPGRIVLRPLQLADYFANPFASERGIISHDPYDRMGLRTQSTSYGYSCRSPVAINQAMPQPATQYNIIIQSGSHEGNPIQPTTQAQIMAPSIVLYQTAKQNLIMDPLYQEPNTSIFQHGTQCPTNMKHLTAGLEYQDQDTPIYQPTMQHLTAAPQYQNPNPKMYQQVTQASLKTWPTDTSTRNPSCDVKIPTQKHNKDIIPIQFPATNPYSSSFYKIPSSPHGNDNPFLTYTDNLNLKPNISGVQTHAENPSSISMSQYPPGLYTTTKSTGEVYREDPNEGSDLYQGYMSLNKPEMTNTNLYATLSVLTGDPQEDNPAYENRKKPRKI